MTEFAKAILKVLENIPKGKVISYGRVAKLAGNDKGARVVTYVLRSKAKEFDLPWHRVIGSDGKIKITDPEYFLVQKKLLEDEGIEVSEKGEVDIGRYGI